MVTKNFEVKKSIFFDSSKVSPNHFLSINMAWKCVLGALGVNFWRFLSSFSGIITPGKIRKFPTYVLFTIFWDFLMLVVLDAKIPENGKKCQHFGKCVLCLPKMLVDTHDDFLWCLDQILIKIENRRNCTFSSKFTFFGENWIFLWFSILIKIWSKHHKKSSCVSTSTFGEQITHFPKFWYFYHFFGYFCVQNDQHQKIQKNRKKSLFFENFEFFHGGIIRL